VEDLATGPACHPRKRAVGRVDNCVADHAWLDTRKFLINVGFPDHERVGETAILAS
jgi:hypothetical protein